MAESKEILGIKPGTLVMFIATTAATIFVVVGIVNNDSTSQTTTGQEPEPATSSSENYQIEDVITSSKVAYQGENGKTALELLKEKTDTTTETASFGEYVTSVNGEDGGGSKFWLFYVNGEPATVGAGEYITEDSDEIEWRLE
ncbi:MAG: DUF4430 domain-containing protein [Candidatus Saccharimonadales bacterium]|nr:DUF4430 domain-containing protein [Candidatus Saccharimonadales bacterium]